MVSTVKINPLALAELNRLATMIAGVSGYGVAAEFGQASGVVTVETSAPANPSVRGSSYE